MEITSGGNEVAIRRILRLVGLGCQLVALRQMAYPSSYAKQMFRNEAHERYGKDNRALEVTFRWLGFFFFMFGGSQVVLSYEKMDENLRTKLKLVGAGWIFDAVFVKWWHFQTSGLVTTMESTVAGVFDFIIGLLNLYLAYS